MDYDGPMHSVQKQTDKLLHEYSKQHWGVVLIDDQADNRLSWISLFFNSARYVLFHDSNFPQYKQALDDWLVSNPCNSRVYTRYGPYTLVISKEHQIPVLQP